MVRHCIFCRSRTGLSLEHVWPEWIWKLSHKKPQKERYTIERFGTHIERQSRKAPSLDQTTRVVCEPCNNRWLSRLENELAKPVVSRFVVPQSSPISRISITDQVALVAWAAKTAFVLDYTTVTPNKHRHFTQDERQEYADTFVPPIGMSIWIADIVRETRRVVHSSVTNIASLATVDAPELKYAGQLSTFHVGSLVFQTLHLRGVREPSPLPPDDFILDDHWNQVVRRIWPSGEDDIPWPPKFYFNEDTLKNFEERLGKNPPVKNS